MMSSGICDVKQHLRLDAVTEFINNVLVCHACVHCCHVVYSVSSCSKVLCCIIFVVRNLSLPNLERILRHIYRVAQNK